ncbi:MAG: hypothetical protein QXY96_02660, partial [Candidatus Methanomethylicaceae archaeon]
MAGILGIYLFDERWDVFNFGVYGLLALQHRGQEYAGLEVFGKLKRNKVAGFGLVENVLVNKVSGNVCIGVVTPSVEDTQPIELDDNTSLVIDGKITKIEGYRWDYGLSYNENLRRAFKGDCLEEFFSKCKGGFSYIA